MDLPFIGIENMGTWRVQFQTSVSVRLPRSRRFGDPEGVRTDRLGDNCAGLEFRQGAPLILAGSSFGKDMCVRKAILDTRRLLVKMNTFHVRNKSF